jgi:hypothetical protein
MSRIFITEKQEGKKTVNPNKIFICYIDLRRMRDYSSPQFVSFRIGKSFRSLPKNCEFWIIFAFSGMESALREREIQGTDGWRKFEWLHVTRRSRIRSPQR